MQPKHTGHWLSGGDDMNEDVKLTQSFNQFNIKIKALGLEVMRIAARETAKEIISRSPVRSGAYIKSHILDIGRDKIRTTRIERIVTKIKAIRSMITGLFTGVHTKDPAKWHAPMFPAYLSQVQEQKLRKLRLQELTAEIEARMNNKVDTVTFRNNIPYAVNVEYTGWRVTPAYHVYGLAKLAVAAKEKVIIKVAERILDKRFG